MATRVLLGLLLLLAAGLKAHALQSGPASANALVLSPREQIGLIELEAFFGVWLLSGRVGRLGWAAAIARFAILAGVSLYLGLDGQASCGCFGRLPVNPWFTFGLDLAAVAALVIWWPRTVAYGEVERPFVLLREKARPFGVYRKGLSWNSISSNYPIKATAMNSFVPTSSRFGPAAIASVLVLTLATLQVPGQEGDRVLQERFLQEAPAQWEEYSLRTGDLQGTLAESITNTNSGRRHQYQWHIEYKCNRESRLLKSSKESSAGDGVETEEKVYAANPRYAFVIHRKSPKTGWHLTTLADLSQEAVPKQIGDAIHEYLRAVTPGASLAFKPLAEIACAPGFRVERCRPVRQGGEDLVEVAFRYTEDDQFDPRTKTGTLLFDPSSHWRLRSADIRVSGPMSQGTKKLRVVETGDPSSRFRALQVDGDYASQDGSRNSQTIRIEATLSRPARLPADEEFTLSAFGLPEPPGIRRPVAWNLWAALLGVLFLVAGGILRYVRQRRARIAPPA